MSAGKLVIHELVIKADVAKRMMQEAVNVRAIGNAVYNEFIKMAQNGAGVDEILMKLPIDIIHEPRGFAEKICREAEYLKSMPVHDETLGKPQNNLFNSPRPNHTESAGEVFAKRTFEVMQDIHTKDGVFLCYDKTIVAVLHTPHGIFVGTNGIKKKPSAHICPRKGQSINQGYDKCVEQCQQPSHAELAALMKYKTRVYEPDFENSWMEVYGAKEVCYHCKTTLELVGIQRITIKPLNQLGEIHDYQ